MRPAGLDDGGAGGIDGGGSGGIDSGGARGVRKRAVAGGIRPSIIHFSVVTVMKAGSSGITPLIPKFSRISSFSKR